MHLAKLVGRIAIGLFLLLLAVGCTPTKSSPQGTDTSSIMPPSPAKYTITEGELARRLGGVITREQPNAVYMMLGANQLVVMPEPHSSVWLNGKCISQASGIVYSGGHVHVPAELEMQIRASVQQISPGALRQVQPPRQTQSPYNYTVSGRVVLDAGHGGKDPGTRARGLIEKNLTLDVTLSVAEQLRRRGVTVVLTRKTDRYLELEERVQIANAAKADLFVAIHADYNPSPDKSGHTILLPQNGNPGARQAAFDINRFMVAGGSPSRAIRTDDRGLYVLRHTNCPAILLEMGFISNSLDASRLADPTFRDRLARSISDGICDYLRHH